MSEIWTFGSVGSTQKEAALKNLAAHFERQAAFLPATVWANGGDLTQLSEAAFLAAVTGRPTNYIVAGFGASRSALAFRAPSITIDGNGVGKVQILKKVGDAVKKAGEAIKNAWAKLVNFIFKGPLQKAADFFLYAFISKSVGPGVERKKNLQLSIVDFIAKATGAKRETVLTTIAAAITQKHGKTPAQILNAASKAQIAGFGALTVAAAIGAIKALKEIIEKIVSFFKKKKEETPNVEDTDAPDLRELETPTGEALTAPDPRGEPVPIPTPAPDTRGETAQEANSPLGSGDATPGQSRGVLTLPYKKAGKGDNTVLIVGVIVAAALLFK